MHLTIKPRPCKRLVCLTEAIYLELMISKNKTYFKIVIEFPDQTNLKCLRHTDIFKSITIYEMSCPAGLPGIGSQRCFTSCLGCSKTTGVCGGGRVFPGESANSGGRKTFGDMTDCLDPPPKVPDGIEPQLS